jgi:aminoglycoside phosphotransferase (APT) family kinase protein
VILAKTYLDRAADEPARPRLAPVVPPGSRAALEFRALSAIAGAFADADPQRLAAIPIHDLLEDRTIVMGVLPWPSLDRIMVRRRLLGRFAGPPHGRAVVEAFRNAGRWLARFRALTLATDGSRLGDRGEILATLAEFGAYLGSSRGGPSPDDRARAVRLAESLLPPTLPTAPGHGDFAMRNLLVGPTGQVAVIDTRARWSVPIEEDLATLLVALRTNRFQSLSQGRAWSPRSLARFEAALLDGAAFDRDALPALRVFELLMLWDKWAAQRARAAGRRSAPARVLEAATERHFRATTAELLRALTAG